TTDRPLDPRPWAPPLGVRAWHAWGALLAYRPLISHAALRGFSRARPVTVGPFSEATQGGGSNEDTTRGLAVAWRLPRARSGGRGRFTVAGLGSGPHRRAEGFVDRAADQRLDALAAAGGLGDRVHARPSAAQVFPFCRPHHHHPRSLPRPD